MSNFAEKEKLFKELYESAIKDVYDGWCYVQDAYLNNYTEDTIDSEVVEKVLAPYNGAVDAWKRFLKKSAYTDQRNIYSAMYELHILPAIAVAVAIRVFVCSEAEIMLECESSKYSEGEIDYWWAISSIAPNGIALDSKAKYKKYLSRLEKENTYTTSKASVSAKKETINKEMPKKASSNSKRVTIDKTWTIKLPQGFIHSTKCFMTEFTAIYNDGTATLSDTLNASCAFDVCNIIKFTESDVDYTIPWATRTITNGTIADINSSNVLIATKNLLLCHNNTYRREYEGKDRYIFYLLVNQKFYFLQVYIGDCKGLNCNTEKEKDRFVFDLVKTIRCVGEGNVDYDKINCANAYNQNQGPITHEEYEEAVREVTGGILSSMFGVPVNVNYTDENSDNSYNDCDEDDDFDPVAAEQAKAEIMDAVSDITASLDSMFEKTKAMAEEARIREEKLIATGEKRPFKHKENDIVPEEFLKAIKAKKTFGYSDMYFEELFEVYDKIIEISEADIDYIQWNTIEDARERVEYIFEKIKENEYISVFNWSVEDAYDSIIFPKDDDTINNDVSKPSDFVIKNGVLEAYNGTASFVDIPEGVMEIADGALGDTGFISEVNLPESLETIGEEFINWSDCTELFIPKNVKSIHVKAFANCHTLSSLSISVENENYSAVDGVLYNKDKTELIFYLDGKKDRVYTIPESVKIIGKSAFDKMYHSSSFPYKMLEKVIIPGNVELIGEAAFAGLNNLRVVEMHNGVKTIEKDAFKNCAKLEEIYIPESIEKLLVSVFAGCKSLRKIYVSNKLRNEKVLENIAKTATKFNAEIIKCDLESLKQKNEFKPTAKPTQPVQPKPQPQTTSTTPVEQKSAPNKTISKPPVVEKTDEILMQEEKANRRIKELEEQIKSNNNSSSSGSGLIAVGVLLVAYFLYCVIDNYNSYQISSAFYPWYYVSTDSITVSLVLLAISSIVLVFGFVKKIKGKKSKELNAKLQEEINLLKDPKNHASYFKNKN